ncbi:MAG: F0F1 ATP synthase subunit A, partial [Pseudomonadota bacterium]
MADPVEGGSGLNIHPMDQFVVKPLFGDGPIQFYTLTNATLWMALTVAAVGLLLVFGARGRALIPTRGQSMAELTYGFVRKMVEDVAGKEGLKYFPYVLTLFTFILFANLLALIPTSFSVT